MAKISITIVQEVAELMYDITNKAFLTGRSREAEGTKNYEAASNMQASQDDEDDYQLRRSLAVAHALIKTKLGEYLNEDKAESDNVIPQEIEDSGQLVYNFLMPSNYNKASVDALGNSVHAFLVYRALAEWFIITNKEDAAEYATLAESSLDNAKRALYKRSRPTRPTF